jgi:transcriptional regulator with XRE-family HTH domain
MTFGEKLKELRIEKNWKQDTIANEIGTDNRAISLYENNKISPSIDTVVRIAQVFNISIDYLLIDDYPRRPLYLNDNSIVDKLQYLEALTRQEKEAVFLLIEGVAYKNKLKNVIGEVK